MTATIDDVRDLIATELSNPDVQGWLDRMRAAAAIPMSRHSDGFNSLYDHPYNTIGVKYNGAGGRFAAPGMSRRPP